MHKGFTVWFTGLSGAGKTTLAEELLAALRGRGHKVEILDGDVVRTNLSKGLGFSKEDRDTNIRRIGFVCKLLSHNGAVAIAAAISPYRAVRDEVRAAIGDFVEVYVKCPLPELLRRDVKGLYAKALQGEIPNFTGVSDPYEEPAAPEVMVETDREAVEESLGKILAKLAELGYLHSDGDGHPDLSGRPGGDGREAAAAALVEPHGGRLLSRLANEQERPALEERAPGLPALRLSPRAAADLELLAVGGYSPLDGFMTSAEYRLVLREMRLRSGLVWPLPITLAASREEASALPEGHEVALHDESGRLLAILHLEERYGYDKEEEAQRVYRTTDAAHPGVAALYGQGDVLLGGRLTVLALPAHPDFGPYRLAPAQTRAAFLQRGWRTVVGFQTRNPVHRAHEYIQKCALEMADGLLLHPLVGETKGDDIPAAVRMRCYEALLEGYYPPGRVLLSVLPAAMRYAGPREAIFHALVRKNYGCSHFIVGRDHAGVGNYYGPYDAQRIFQEFSPGELGITPLFFDNAFFCRCCGNMASEKTCPHGEEERVTLSGTRVRAMLAAGETPPPEFTRPEVAHLLLESMSGSAKEEAKP